MDGTNTRQYTDRELVEELIEIGLLTEKEAKVYVYSEILDDDSVENLMPDSMSENEIEVKVSRAKNKITSAKKTKEVLSKDYDGIQTEIDVIIGAGLLDENQAESYVHYERFGGQKDELSDILDRPTVEIERDIETAEEKIEQARETISFLIRNTGIQKF